MKLVTYTGNDEVIVTTEGDEASMLKEYNDRNWQEYDREVHGYGAAVRVYNNLKARS